MLNIQSLYGNFPGSAHRQSGGTSAATAAWCAPKAGNLVSNRGTPRYPLVDGILPNKNHPAIGGPFMELSPYGLLDYNIAYCGVPYSTFGS